MGLGLLGRGVGDIKFLAECGAKLIVTDLKSDSELAPSLRELKEYEGIEFVLGKHRLEDFENRDLILKAAGVRQDSEFIAHARRNNIPIEMSAALFAKLSKVQMIGVTGTRGKSMTTQFIFEILKAAGKRVLLGGNVRGISNLQLLKEVKRNTIAVFELDSWQLQGFGEDKISPHVSVFTNFYDDHLNYYKTRDSYFQDKAQIFLHQSEDDYLVVQEELKQYLRHFKINSTLKVATSETLPSDWKLQVIGDHMRRNAGCAKLVADIMDIPEKITRKVLENFEGMEGRMQFLRQWRDIKIYNDNNATTPSATLAALSALPGGKDLVLIMGGADKGIDMSELVSETWKRCKNVILLPGTGSERIRKEFDQNTLYLADDLKSALILALKSAKDGETILFSPAFASFGLFKNEYDRNDQFVALVKRLK